MSEGSTSGGESPNRRSPGDQAATLESGPTRGVSLRRKAMLVVMAGGLVVALGLTLLLFMGFRVAQELDWATQEFIEEQRMADDIAQGVMEQFATAGFFRVDEGPPPAGGETGFREPLAADAARRSFEEAGEAVYQNLRRYLFRDLSQEQRLQLEAMAEEHQRLEVAAGRAMELHSRGDSEGAANAHAAMAARAVDLMESTEAFVAMREEDLDGLRSRHIATYRVLLGGGSALMLLVLVSSLGLVWYFHSRVARALGTLAHASERLEAGDLDVRVPRGREPEFQKVSADFNRMARSIRHTTDDLQRRNQELADTLQHLQDTQAELIQSEKLNAMGRMSAGIAHELNNPLGSVLGYAQTLDLQLGAGRKLDRRELQEEFLGPILQEAERARTLVRNFLHFSRRSNSELGPVNLRRTVDLVAQLRRYAFDKAGLGLEVEIPEDLHVLADEQMLQGAVLNLVNNALDAMRPQGRGLLRVHLVAAPSESGGSEAGETNAGPAATLAFDDEGPGFENPERVFEPFYTTKGVGEGTGLGLTLVERYVSGFGGQVEVENRTASGGEEGGGRVRVTLPTADPLPEEPEEEGTSEDALRNAGGPEDASGIEGARVLVVEDEAPLRKLEVRLLGRLGATALPAADAGEGRRILAKEGGDGLDAILCDIKMPGESGLEFYRWLRQSHPELAEERFLFVTGDVSGEELAELEEEHPDLFIHKPFDAQEFMDRLTALLEAPTRS